MVEYARPLGRTTWWREGREEETEAGDSGGGGGGQQQRSNSRGTGVEGEGEENGALTEYTKSVGEYECVAVCVCWLVCVVFRERVREVGDRKGRI